MRPDIPPRLFRELLVRATEVVQQRLLAAGQARNPGRDPARAGEGLRRGRRQGRAARLCRGARAPCARCTRPRKLNEAELADFAKSGKYEETVAALATSVRGADRGGGPADERRPADPILILARAAGFGWPTARDDHHRAAGPRSRSPPALDAAFANFERLSAATAQRVVRFWQVAAREADRKRSDSVDSSVVPGKRWKSDSRPRPSRLALAS